ncbi:hypothetical protein TNCV_3018791 [Trichonephila clavipes]|nr:hypothetical protein TNCV_3018791 [Trichonephila clavipes]
MYRKGVKLKGLTLETQWSSGSEWGFHITGPDSFLGLGKVDSAFHPYCSGSINEYQAGLGASTLGVSLQTDHMIETPAHAPQRSMFMYSGDRFNSCQVIYSQFGLAIHQNDHQARRRFVEWAQNEIAVVPDFHKRILFSDEAHFWLNGYVNKQNCRIWSEANPQVYVETPLHPEKLTVCCALWAGGILLQKR